MMDSRRWGYGLILSILTISVICPLAMAEQPTQSLDELESRLAQNPDDASAHYGMGLLLAMKGDALAFLETAIRLEPQNMEYGNTYRAMCVKFHQTERATKFFEQTVREMEKAKQDFPELRINHAMSYVDQMPSSNIGIVTQAQLSTKSMRELKKVLEKKPDFWIATFAMGMNHLYWPKAMKHSPKSIEFFQKCLVLQDDMMKKEGKPKNYFVRVYIGLGDAYAKNGEFDKAHEIWRKGQEYFPEEVHLKERLAIADNEALINFIDDYRQLAARVNTDLSITWSPESVSEKITDPAIAWSAESVYRDIFGPDTY
jgi:tetratricopeptide (TPR) repeat protein